MTDTDDRNEVEGEVVDPARTIGKAIPMALGITLLVYALVTSSALAAVDAPVLARAAAPLVVAVEAGRLAWLSPAIRIGAAIASLGVLLSLIVGVSRTVFAMASTADLPAFLAAVHPRYRVPHRAELGAGLIVAIIVSVADLRGAIGFSSFTVLAYYAVTNAAALHLAASQRRWSRALAVVGLVGCASLAFTLPLAAVAEGSVLLAAGALLFLLRNRKGVDPKAKSF